ncbi:hypothetical protein M5K25_021328 [Dendrobium thyrsiflorum]|uniref:Uncharacterized protein n=1 Tax=Dendrobium thyrsiflorum TaxID=117978 RepID=A0ABD0UC41_DENTH
MYVEERRRENVRSSLVVEHKSVINVRISHAWLAVEMKEGGGEERLGDEGWLADVMNDRIKHCLSHVAGKADECSMCAGTGRCHLY